MTSTSGADNEEQSFLEYQPIDTSRNEIRIIRLQALDHSTDEPVVRCTLEHVSFRQNPGYSALSYVWGDTSITKSISVNGKPFSATVNLESALRQLASGLTTQVSKEMCLWVDALCINQSNNQEKTQQVALMDQIYKRASDVFIWLGPPCPRSPLAFQTLRALVKVRYSAPLQQIESWPLFRFSPTDTAVQRALLHVLDYLTASHASALLAVFALFERPWFRRVWVIQELALSRKPPLVLAGADALRWDDFWAACWVLTGLRDCLSIAMPRGAHSLVAATALTRKLGNVAAVAFAWLQGPKPLLYFLGLLAQDTDEAPLRASDERDFVYGLLSLVSDMDRLHIAPDYAKGWSEVRVEVARKCLLRYGPNMLSFCGLEHSGVDVAAPAPSWAPNWAAAGDLPRPFSVESSIRVRGGWKKSAYNACGTLGQTVAEWCFGPDGSLALFAASVDHVSLLGGDLPLEEFGADGSSETGWDEQLAVWLADLGGLLTEPNNIYTTEEQVADALWKTPIADRGQVYNYETERATEVLNAGHQVLVSEERAGVHQVRAARYAAIARRKLRRRRPFKTSEGYLGIGPDGMQIGDFIWIIPGTYVPLVLRNRGHEAWSIVGEAYVHGIMDGEVMGRGQTLKTINII